MSNIQTIGQQVSKMVTDAKSGATNLSNLANNVGKLTQSAQQAMEGTSAGSYQVVLAQLNIAQKTIREAAQNLASAANAGEDWLAKTVSGGGGGSASGGTSPLPSASSQPRPKVLRMDTDTAIRLGLSAIAAQMEAVKDDLKDKGITDPEKVDAIIKEKREKAEIEFYDTLFGKVQDRTIAAVNNLSAYFTEDNWKKMKEDERKDALDTLARDVGSAYRTNIKGAKFFTGPSNERGYYNGDGYLYLNSDCLSDVTNRLDALDTIFHEGRHAFQRECLTDPHRYGITEELAKTWEDNFHHYLRYERFGYDRYYNQPVEKDAFTWAAFIIKTGGIV